MNLNPFWRVQSKMEVKSKKGINYYPFGLTIDALSWERDDAVPNRYLYNDGSELQDELGLNVYSTKLRTLDPALGRWWQIDPLADSLEWKTPYNSMHNNPIRYNDPDGDCGLPCTALAGALIGAVAGGVVAAIEDDATIESVLIGAGAGAVSGAIIGSGAGLLAGSAALSSSIVGVVSTSAATGAVAGVAEESTKQVLEVATDKRESLNTAQIVEAGAVGAVVNVVAAPLAPVIGSITGASVGASQTVANKVVKPAVKIGQEVGGKILENVCQDQLDRKPK